MKVFVKEPGKGIIEKEITEGLETLQGLVDGYIEQVSYIRKFSNNDITMLVNEEGLINELEPNIVILEGREVVSVLFGTVVFIGARAMDDEFSSITKEQEKIIKCELIEGYSLVGGELVSVIQM